MCGGDARASETVLEYGNRGFRCLGVARKESTSSQWMLVGLLAFLDPPRPDSKQTIIDTRGIENKERMGEYRR